MFARPEALAGAPLPALPPQWRAAALSLGVLCAVLVVSQMETLTGLMRVWWSSPTYNHGFLVLPAALYLVWRRRGELAMLTPAPAWSAIPLLAGACALALLGEIGGIAAMQHLAFVLILMFIVPVACGWRVARRFAFPLLFLLFMVPVGEVAVPFLQEITADASVWMLRASSVPVYREGIMIELPAALFEVAEACAGLRFIVANVVVAAMFAYFSYDRAWKWIVFGILAFAVPIGANFVRAYGIMMIAHLTDGALAMGVDHLVYGWVFFSAVMLLLLWIGSLFADRTMRDPAAAPAPSPEPADGQRHAPLTAALAAVAVLAAVPALAALTTPAPDGPPGRSLTIDAAGWERAEPAIDWQPRFESADALYRFAYRREGRQVDLMIAFYTHQREGAEAVHYANRFDDGEIWVRSELGAAPVETGASGLPPTGRREILTFARIGEQGAAFQSRAVLSWLWSGGALTANAKRAKLAQIAARLGGGETAAAVIAVSTDYARPGDRAAAMEAMSDLLDALPRLKPVLEGISG